MNNMENRYRFSIESMRWFDTFYEQVIEEFKHFIESLGRKRVAHVLCMRQVADPRPSHPP